MFIKSPPTVMDDNMYGPGEDLCLFLTGVVQHTAFARFYGREGRVFLREMPVWRGASWERIVGNTLGSTVVFQLQPVRVATCSSYV